MSYKDFFFSCKAEMGFSFQTLNASGGGSQAAHSWGHCWATDSGNFIWK